MQHCFIVVVLCITIFFALRKSQIRQVYKQVKKVHELYVSYGQ